MRLMLRQSTVASVCFYWFMYVIVYRDILIVVPTHVLHFHCSVSIWRMMFTPAHWISSKTVTSSDVDVNTLNLKLTVDA